MDVIQQYCMFIFIGCITGILTGFTGASGMSVLISGLLIIGIQIREVIALTFVVTLANSAIAAIPYWRRGNIPTLPAILMGLPAAAAVFFGYKVSFSFSSVMLGWVIIAGLVSAGVKFTFFDRPVTENRNNPGRGFPLWTLFIPGVLIGVIMGILGGGGGVFITLVLVFVYRIEAHKALGISLVVMAAAAIPGGALYAQSGFLTISIALAMIIPSMVCAFIAARYANRMGDRTIKKLLGIYLIVISLFLTLKNLHLFKNIVS